MAVPTPAYTCPRILAATVLALVPVAVAAQEGPVALSDAEIAHIAVTANAIDAELAELALTRSTDERVRAFAERMIADHTALNEAAAALAGQLGVTPADNEVSRNLRAGAVAAERTLREVEGGAFDRAYVDREVAYHQAVLGALDETLIPGATNAGLRALLGQARGGVAAHLEHARTLRGELGGVAR